MFLLDFAVGTLMEDLLDWIYGCIVAFLNSCFTQINGMGTELFDTIYAKALILLFAKLGWVLYGVGLLVAVFECAIASQDGRGDVKATAINAIKGFMAASLFHTVPVLLYNAAVRWQGIFGGDVAGLRNPGDVGASALEVMGSFATGGGSKLLFGLFLLIAMGYCVIKVFFANIKRGGILLVQVAVGSLYMLSVPRGKSDGFHQWCKQVIGICLTAFLQSLILTIGLRIFKDHALLGVGVLLSSTEVPRICGQFGLDTSARANVMGGIYAAQTAFNITKTIAKAAA